MTVVVIVCGVLLTLGAALAIVRAEKGPTMLDRTVALDIVVTTMLAGIALYAAVNRRADVVPILVVLSLVGFVGSVTIARFASVEPEGEGRVRSREEVAAEEAERRRQELAEVVARRRPAEPATPDDDGLSSEDRAAVARGYAPDGTSEADDAVGPGSPAARPPSAGAEHDDEHDDEHHGGGAEGEVR